MRPVSPIIPTDEERLSQLAMCFRSTRQDGERRKIATEYAEVVERLIKSGRWNEMPPLDDQLPDDWMSANFFDFWSNPEPTIALATQVDRFDDLLADPRESLGVEIKQWLDPQEDEGKAKIAKACIALRNNDGGVLIIGIQDDGHAALRGRPPDVRRVFRQDTIQDIVTKYASEPFEVTVCFRSKDGEEYPVIHIPPGVRTPVACRADLPGDGRLLKSDTVYVRTLQANHRVSSSAALWKDWEPLIKHCFDNREADIGAFFRRHLSGLDLRGILDAMTNEAGRRRKLTGAERAVGFLDEAYTRFESAASRRGETLEPRLGIREAAIVVDGEIQRAELSEEALYQLDATVPRHTGWHPWVMLRNPDDAPYVIDDGWEAYIHATAPGLFGAHLDFWRIEASGRLYHLRGLEDDLAFTQQAPPPYTSLDFGLEIGRTAEILSDAIAIGAAFCAQTSKAQLCVAMRLRNLEGRSLTSWAAPSRWLRSRTAARQTNITTSVALPLDTPRNALAPYVEKLVAPVFALFGGMKVDTGVIEGIVQETIGRRM